MTGFWDAHISALEAIGVPVSIDARTVLNEGGRVLVIQHLLSYGACQGDDQGMYDQNENEVYIPQLMQAVSPDESQNYLEDWYGSTWRQWPSYTGTMEEPCVDLRFWNDSQTFARVWEGLPIMGGHDADIADRLLVAAQSRINDSVYEALCTVLEFETAGEYEYTLDDLLPLMDMIRGDPDVDIDDLLEFTNADDFGYLKYVAVCMQDLVSGNFISFRDYNLTSNNQEVTLNDCEFAPMETYLRDDHEALAVWSRLINRRENALAIITNALPRTRGYQFSQEERST